MAREIQAILHEGITRGWRQMLKKAVGRLGGPQP